MQGVVLRGAGKGVGVGLRLRVRDGTPQHGQSLCFSCDNSHVIQGQALSDLTVFCTHYFDKPLRMQHPVAECTAFQRKNTQDKREMEKIAWILETKRGRLLGFYNPEEHKHRQRSEDLDDPEE